MRRRDFFRLAGAAAMALPTTARAQFNASKPITMIVPFPAGGGADILVRLLTKYMGENLGHPFIVQNQPGAGGGLAFGQVARAAPDGQTLGWISTGFPVMAATLSNLTFKPESDFVHVCNVSENPFVLVVNPQVPAKSVKELVDLAKAKPNTLNFAHNGAATLTNLVVELLKIQAGIEVAQVAYRGDNFSVTDVIAGHVQGMFSNSPVALPHVAAGRLRGLAVTSPKRSSAAPDLPTMAESGYPDFKAVVWQGIQCARRHAARGCRSSQCLCARSAAGAGGGDALSGAWSGTRRIDSGGACATRGARDRRVERCRPALRRQGKLAIAYRTLAGMIMLMIALLPEANDLSA